MRLLRPIWPLVAVSSAIGALSGLATATVLAKVNTAIHAEGGLSENFIPVFFGLVLLGVGGSLLSGLGSALASGRISAGLSRDLADMILTAPIDRIEQIGRHKVLASLNTDAGTLSTTVAMLSGLIIQSGVTVGCLVYMLTLSAPLLAITLLVFGLGSYVENILRRRAMVGYRTRRSLADTMQKHFQSLTEGSRELRLNRQRRMRLRDGALTSSIEELRRNEFRTHTLLEFSYLTKKLALFATIAAIVTYKATLGIDNAVLSGFVLVLLYIELPVTYILAILPEIGRARIAYQRIAEFSAGRTVSEPNLLAREDTRTPRTIEEIELRGVSHAFPAVEGKRGFTLGPIDLTVRRGEILFIVGENGSGKTTLIKLILGLYPPQTGTPVPRRGAGDGRDAGRLPPAFLGGVLRLLPVRRSRPARRVGSGGGGCLSRDPGPRPQGDDPGRGLLPPSISRPGRGSAWPWSRPISKGGRSSSSTSGRQSRTPPSAACSTRGSCRT